MLKTRRSDECDIVIHRRFMIANDREKVRRRLTAWRRQRDASGGGGRGPYDWQRGGIPLQQANTARERSMPFLFILPARMGTTGDLPSKQIPHARGRTTAVGVAHGREPNAGCPNNVLALPPPASTTGDLPSKQILAEEAARPPQRKAAAATKCGVPDQA